MSGCAIPGCTDPCRSGELMCKWHWRKVPASTKSKVLETWRAVRSRAGSEGAMSERLSIIRNYQEARAAAITDVCLQEGLRAVIE